MTVLNSGKICCVCNYQKGEQYDLNFVTKWWISMSISSLASSLPGHECAPLPNGIKVLGFGGTWASHPWPQKRRMFISFSFLIPHLYTLIRKDGSPYLKSSWVEALRIREEVWVVMDVPEQWHHLPTLWDHISCKNQSEKWQKNESYHWSLRIRFSVQYIESVNRVCLRYQPLYSTSTTASRKVNDMMLAILRLSNVT